MYYKKFKLAVFVGIVFFGFSSCGKDEDPVETTKYVLTVTPASADVLNFAGAELNVTVDVKDEKSGAAANVSWDVSSSDAWISYDPQRGTGSGAFKITAAANPNEAERTAKVTVSIRNSDVKQELTLKQGPKDVNFIVTRKGKFSDFCVGNDTYWPADWGAHCAVLYKKLELGADGVLTINTHYRLHYTICEYEPGYITFVSVADKQYAPAWEVERTAGKSDFLACGLPRLSNKYLTTLGTDVASDSGELWDHLRGSQAAKYELHLKAGTYWFVALRASTSDSEKNDPQSPYFEMSQYPIDVDVDEIFSFLKD